MKALIGYLSGHDLLSRDGVVVRALSSYQCVPVRPDSLQPPFKNETE